MATAYQPTRQGQVKVYDPAQLPAHYAMTGSGNCMVPLVKDGTTLVFDKAVEPEPGDLVIIWFRPEHSPLPGTHAIFKRLVGLPPVALPFDVPVSAGSMPSVVVEMLNPPRLLAYPAAHVLAVHKCVGEALSLGNGVAAWRPNEGGDQ